MISSQNFKISLGLILLALFSTLTSAVFAQAQTGRDSLPHASSSVTYGDPGEGTVLVLGCVTNNPKYNYGRMQDMANYVLKHSSDLGVNAVEVFVVDSAEKMVRLLENGRVDWVAATPYSALTFEAEANAEILVVKKIRGQANYRSVMFSREDSGIVDLKDLVGKVITFEKPGSTSAFFLPAIELIQAGYRLQKLDSPRDKPDADAIGYVFSGDEANSSIWVHKGFVDAAAFSDDDWDSDWHMPDAFRGDLKIFHQTRSVPRSIEMVRSDLEPKIKERLQQVLIDAGGDPEAASAMEGYYNSSDFSPLSQEQMNALESVRAILPEFNRSIADLGATK